LLIASTPDRAVHPEAKARSSTNAVNTPPTAVVCSTGVYAWASIIVFSSSSSSSCRSSRSCFSREVVECDAGGRHHVRHGVHEGASAVSGVDRIQHRAKLGHHVLAALRVREGHRPKQADACLHVREHVADNLVVTRGDQRFVELVLDLDELLDRARRVELDASEGGV
jgi:hypothetical protein